MRAFLALGLLGATVATHAHHSGAMYDLGKRVTIEGTVTRLDWANPHVYIYVEQTEADGRTTAWEIETFPPATMRRHGWSPDTLRVGDEIVVSGNPSRNVAHGGLYPHSIQRGDATLYEVMAGTQRLATSSAADAAVANSLDGTWATLLTMDVVLRFARHDYPLTAAGTAAVASFDERTMSPGSACISNAAPLFMIDPDIKRISTEDGAIVIAGGYATERRIHMDVATHAGASASVQGHSIGRWDGSTLVIDTTHFASHKTGNGYTGVPSGAMKHLLERLTLDASGTTLTYSFELRDPEFLAAPVSGEVRWAHRPDLEFVRDACDLDTARRFIKE
jgi:hypothetical protein